MDEVGVHSLPTCVCSYIEPEAAASRGQSSTASASSGEEVKSKLLSFWVPALTPNAKPTEVKKPVSVHSQSGSVRLLLRCSLCCRKFKGQATPSQVWHALNYGNHFSYMMSGNKFMRMTKPSYLKCTTCEVTSNIILIVGIYLWHD